MTTSRVSRLLAAFLICATALVLASCAADSGKSSQDSDVLGTWTLAEAYYEDGTLYPEEEMSTTRATYEFSPDTVREDWGDGEVYESPYTLSDDGHTATITYDDGHTETLEFDEGFTTFTLLYHNEAEPEYWGRTYVFTSAA